MPTSRTPIGRPRRTPLPLEAVDVFREMKTLACTCTPVDWEGAYWEYEQCAACERWWRLHARLFELWPRARPWWWPIIQNPDARCPYPEGSAAAKQWKLDPDAVARWRQLEAMLADREGRSPAA